MRSVKLVNYQAKRLLQLLEVSTPPFPIQSAVALAGLRISDLPLGAGTDGIPPELLANQTMISAFDHAFGLLDRHNSLIYLKANMLPVRRNFVTMHEVGHAWLPWQRPVETHWDGEDNFGLDTTTLHDWQANVFATETLFLGSALTNLGQELAFDLNTVFQLASTFDTSLHATLRRYVQTHRQRCFMLVVDRQANVLSRRLRHRVVQQFSSPAFRRTYPNWRQRAMLDASLLQPVVSRSAPTTLELPLFIPGDGEMTRVTLQGFDNGHHILLFGRPQDGQRLPPRIITRIRRL